MSVLDRVVRDARRDLDPMEGLIGCVQGREADGRRRIVVIATDRRVLLVMPRRSPAVRIDYQDLLGVTVERALDGPVLRLTTASEVHDIAHVTDDRALALLVDLVTARKDAPPAREERPARVRIIA